MRDNKEVLASILEYTASFVVDIFQTKTLGKYIMHTVNVTVDLLLNSCTSELTLR